MGIKESFLAERRVLLAGNGISDAQKISWNDMLSYVQEKLTQKDKTPESEKIEEINNISPTLFFESLCKKSAIIKFFYINENFKAKIFAH